jgi:hypothetical protein
MFCRAQGEVCRGDYAGGSWNERSKRFAKERFGSSIAFGICDMRLDWNADHPSAVSAG